MRSDEEKRVLVVKTRQLLSLEERKMVRQTLLWELETTDMQVLSAKPEPLLEAVAELVTKQHPDWAGTPTELAAVLQSDFPPNKLTMKIGINAARLFNEYGIRFDKVRIHAGRQITLHKEFEPESE